MRIKLSYHLNTSNAEKLKKKRKEILMKPKL